MKALDLPFQTSKPKVVRFGISFLFFLHESNPNLIVDQPK